MRVVGLVPRRSDHGRRDEIWRWVSKTWSAAHKDIPLFIGESDDGPFNKSQAVNRAAILAGDWDVAIVIDADSFVTPELTRLGVKRSLERKGVCLPYTRYSYLRKDISDKVMCGYAGNLLKGAAWTIDWSVAGQVIIPREIWECVGGFDERFVGWGCEDTAFYIRASSCGDAGRLDGYLWHLWHPLASREQVDSNRLLLKEYM